MADRQGKDFNSYRGSYAGALGIPQFSPIIIVIGG